VKTNQKKQLSWNTKKQPELELSKQAKNQITGTTDDRCNGKDVARTEIQKGVFTLRRTNKEVTAAVTDGVETGGKVELRRTTSSNDQKRESTKGRTQPRTPNRALRNDKTLRKDNHTTN